MLTTCKVLCVVHDSNGIPSHDAIITATLDRYEVSSNGYVVPRVVQGKTDSNGQCVLDLWPNELGSTESSYTIRIVSPRSKPLVTRAYVPNVQAANLWDLADLPAYEGKPDGQLIIDEAIAAVAPAVAAKIAAEAAQQAAESAASLADVSANEASSSEVSAENSKNIAISAKTEAQYQAESARLSSVLAADKADFANQKAAQASNAADSALAYKNSAETAANTAVSKVTEAAGYATTAGIKADSAASSASEASSQASIAGQAAGLAATSSANAAQSAQASAQSAIEAGNKSASANLSANTATQKAADAAASAATATSQATVATTKASEAAASASTASTKATEAANSASTATTKADTATTKADTAASSAATAAAQAVVATAKAAESATSASTANTKAGEAAGSAAQALAIYGSTTAQQAALASAQSAASLAQGYAASASSVVQQDLSAVVAAALHRSPNAVTAMFIYDTSKDSDGGAWTEKCQHTSWYNEALNGKWLGSAASEAAARAVSGAATGDYFQLTTDGKFYKLNATSGTTEVFRGNKAKFPKVAAIIAEAANVTIYDLTEPGRPMFARFGNTSGYAFTGSASCLAAMNAKLVIGSGSGEFEIDFAADSSWQRNATSFYRRNANLANRNIVSTFMDLGSTNKIISATVNAVAMTVLPDAPIDPLTGLKVPTIAVATAGGISVIRHSGAVTNKVYSPANAYKIAINGTKIAVSGGTTTAYWGQTIWDFVTDTSYLLGSSSPGIGLGANSQFENLLFSGKKENFVGRYYNGGVGVGKLNYSTFAKSIAAGVTNTYNTGHLLGDIRRAYLSDSVVGSVTGTELITNGTFDTGISPWFDLQGLGQVVWDSSGKLSVSDVGGNDGKATVRIGGAELEGKRIAITFTSSNSCYVGVGGLTDSNWTMFYAGIVGAGTTTIYVTLGSISLVNSYGVTLACINTNTTALFDNVSVKVCVEDRSYKAKGTAIAGTLTKSLSATANQLVAYSGFSAANYLQEPYSADLDFGTGDWSVSAWMNIPTANASAARVVDRAYSSGASISLGITAANYLTATAFDGTTTRTVTTTTAYNTATWIKARGTYKAGKLAITVNGVEVAATYGVPLLTLNNSSAVLTIGNSYALDAPFPGSLALVKLSATVPTPEQALWMYQQEMELFRDGANCLLPDSGNILDLSYDDATDSWLAVSGANESRWTGLIRTGVTATPAGTFSKVAANSGICAEARITTSPGVDISIPAYGLREELFKRAERAAAMNQDVTVFDYAGGFTATTSTTGAAAYTLTSVSGLSYPSQANLIGAVISGTGITAGTSIVAISGSTIYIDKPATAAASGVQISLTDFPLPTGYETRAVLSAGALKYEGATKDYTRLFDGFKETIRFGIGPAYNANVQIQAVRSA